MLFRRFCSHATSAVKIRDFKEMPCLSALQTFKFIKSQYNGTVMEVFTEFEQIYGGCYRSELPGLGNVLQLSDVGGIEQMFRQDHVDVPKRFVVPPWKRWRDESKKPYGLLITNSSDWKRMRSAINKNLSRPASAAMYTSDLSAITTEFVKFVEEKQEAAETRGVLIQKLLFIWSLESISCVLYGQRLGAFNKNVNPTVNEFIEASSGILPATSEAVFLPTFLAKIFCKAHDDGWKTVFEIGERMVDEKLLQIQEEISSGLQPTGFLANMFANENISRDDIYGNVTDLMMAAVDTTTATMQWILCMLTENPAVEQKLYEEICNVVGNDQDITQEHLERMTYLKAIVKETLRLYPVTLVITKIASSEMVICGHRIPTGTLITCPVGVSGRDPDVFHDPDQFIPERWIGKQGKDINKFASLPFSFGARMCAGRRFAELQLYLLTTKFVQQFKLEMIGPPRKVKTAGLVVPTPDVKIVFNRRS